MSNPYTCISLKEIHWIRISVCNDAFSFDLIDNYDPCSSTPSTCFYLVQHTQFSVGLFFSFYLSCQWLVSHLPPFLYKTELCMMSPFFFSFFFVIVLHIWHAQSVKINITHLLVSKKLKGSHKYHKKIIFMTLESTCEKQESTHNESLMQTISACHHVWIRPNQEAF